MNPIPGARLTCVSDQPVAAYSGMLAGTLAGQYEQQEMQIDLVRFCAACGVRLVVAAATGLEHENKRVLLEDRPALDYDLLSIGVGSRPLIPLDDNIGLSIKPMQTFMKRLTDRIGSVAAQKPQDPIDIVIVGGGAAGIEIAFCLETFLRNPDAGNSHFTITLVEAANSLFSESTQRAQLLVQEELTQRGIRVLLDSRVVAHEGRSALQLEGGEHQPFDLLIWATPATPPRLFESLGLPKDDRGFLLTKNTLQSTGADDVFVVGDSGSVLGEQYAKAGVYAVRQGPFLWENLRRKVQGESLKAWRPQSQFLSLINTGDGSAVLSYRSLAVHSPLAWKLKDWIDRRFMAKYQDYSPPQMMATSENSAAEIEQQMQCGGCGSKAPPQVLQTALPILNQAQHDHVLMGLSNLDDIALIAQREGRAIAASTDFFSSFVDDPFLLGRIAAQNALSDLYVKGSSPRAALSMAVLPHGSPQKQAALLDELLAGAGREFQAAGVPIVGGHSIVGPKLTFGFTMLGDAEPEGVLRKSTLRDGDCLVLTKALGTGVLLAAHMRAACRAEWWGPLVDSMLTSNEQVSQLAAQLPVSAATDVTGFGLAGHLLEMLAPADLSSEISLSSLPLLPGAGELFQRNFESSLAPSIRDSCTRLETSEDLRDSSLLGILFDPQTSGGVLMAIPEVHCETLLSECEGAATRIGRVVQRGPGGSTLEVTP